jgi:hypothetical protein
MTKKNVAKAVFALTLAVTTAVGVWAHLYEAPYKTVEKYYDAIERGDEKTFDKYADGGVTINEALEIALSGSGFTKEDDPEFKVKFISREQNGNSVLITVGLTVYNDERHTDTRRMFIVKPYRFGMLEVSETG